MSPQPRTARPAPTSSAAATGRRPARPLPPRSVPCPTYAHFARSYAGIAKAKASWVWNGLTTVAHVTVAGDGTTAVDPTLATSLAAAIRVAGDPHRPFSIDSYEALTFDLKAGVFLQPGF